MGKCTSKCSDIKKARKSALLTPLKHIKVRKSNFRVLYQVEDMIQEESNSPVFLVTDRVTGEQRAIKSIEISGKKLNTTLYEVSILQKLDHPNIIKIYEAFLEAKHLHIVTEYCSGGKLFDRILSKIYCPENTAAKYMKQITSALVYLHNNGIIHKDLKPSNLFFADDSEDPLVKLVNFTKKNSDSFLFRAPEGFSMNFVLKSDVWSLGVIFYFMLSGSLPFPDAQKADEHFINIQGPFLSFKGRIWESVSDEAKELISRMLKKNPEDRLSALEVYQSDWMKSRFSGMGPARLSKKSLKLLGDYLKMSKLKRAMLTYMVGRVGLTDEAEDLMRIFRETDTNGQGELRPNQIIDCIKHADVSFVNSPRVVASMNINKKGLVSYSEFLTAFIDWSKELSEDKLLKAFREFDINGDGVITTEEFLEVLQTDCSVDEMKEMIKEADRNGDGLIDFEEFSYFFKAEN